MFTLTQEGLRPLRVASRTGTLACPLSAQGNPTPSPPQAAPTFARIVGARLGGLVPLRDPEPAAAAESAAPSASVPAGRTGVHSCRRQKSAHPGRETGTTTKKRRCGGIRGPQQSADSAPAGFDLVREEVGHIWAQTRKADPAAPASRAAPPRGRALAGNRAHWPCPRCSRVRARSPR